MITKGRLGNKEKGSLMLEFLLSLAIFSICIAGLAILQNKSVKNLASQKDAMANGFILEDIISRVGANRENLRSYVTGSGNDVARTDIEEINVNAAAFNRKVSLTAHGSDDQELKIRIESAEKSGEDVLEYTMYFQVTQEMIENS